MDGWDSLVYVYSQDAAVLGGSMGEMHAKKICNIYSMAMKMGAPVIGLVDCAGLRLQEATDALDGFGKLYLSQTMASGVIPQIMAGFAAAVWLFLQAWQISPLWKILLQNCLLIPKCFRGQL